MEMASWGTLMITMTFASILVAIAVLVSERFGGVWAPVWIICFLIGMSILFDYGGVRQTELHLLGRNMLFACGPMLWPVLALGQDYINEFYGKKIAINYTLGMFLAKIGVALGTLWIILVLPVPVSNSGMAGVAEQFNRLMMLSPRLNVASIIAVVAAFFANAWVYDKIRGMTKGKKLWLRNMVSSALALTIDAFVFYIGGFALVLPWPVVFEMSITYLLVCYTTIFIDMFFLYAMVEIKNKKFFGVDDRVGQSLSLQTLKAYQES